MAESLEIQQGANPLSLFAEWYEKARTTEPSDPDAAALATVSDTVWPNVRMVLVKKVDENGFVFFTNTKSQKGKELDAVTRAALCFYWKSQRRQIRVQGSVEPVVAKLADDYFDSRHPLSRRSAIISRQSAPLTDRQALENALNELKEKHPDDALLKRPSHWSGYRIVPLSIEFWQQGENRLHDRFLFKRETAGENWILTRLFP